MKSANISSRHPSEPITKGHKYSLTFFHSAAAILQKRFHCSVLSCPFKSDSFRSETFYFDFFIVKHFLLAWKLMTIINCCRRCSKMVKEVFLVQQLQKKRNLINISFALVSNNSSLFLRPFLDLLGICTLQSDSNASVNIYRHAVSPGIAFSVIDLHLTDNFCTDESF